MNTGAKTKSSQYLLGAFFNLIPGIGLGYLVVGRSTAFRFAFMGTIVICLGPALFFIVAFSLLAGGGTGLGWEGYILFFIFVISASVAFGLINVLTAFHLLLLGLREAHAEGSLRIQPWKLMAMAAGSLVLIVLVGGAVYQLKETQKTRGWITHSGYGASPFDSALAVGNDGHVWIGTSRELYVSTDELFTGLGEYPNVQFLAMGLDDRLWMVGEIPLEGGPIVRGSIGREQHSKAIIYGVDRGVLETMPLPFDFDPFDRAIRAIAADPTRDGRIAVATYQGLLILEDGEWQVLDGGAIVLQCAFDDKGTLWYFTADTLVSYTDSETKRIIIKPPLNFDMSGVGGSASRAYRDRPGIAIDADGRVWLGEAQNARIWDGKALRPAFPEPLEGIYPWDGRRQKGMVRAIAFDSLGRAWMSLSPGGLIILEQGKMKVYTRNNSGLEGVGVSSIAFDKGGRAWLIDGYWLTSFDDPSLVP